MVYCGKPSKGCESCRSRKIRCDQARPSCSQCIRTQRACPGYRDALSLMFRDESQDVVRKAKKASPPGRSPKTSKKTSRAPSPVGSARTVCPSGDSSLSEANTSAGSVIFSDPKDDSQLLQLAQQHYRWRQPTSPSFGTEPSYTPTDNDAVGFFFRHNIWPGSFWMVENGYEILTQTRGSPSQRAMKSSIVAVGTALLSRTRKSPSLELVAEKEYGSALEHMAAAVSNDVEAKSNPTLASVLLLAIFELIVNSSVRSIENWTNHIRGAVGLLELRGVEQLQTPTGLNLFVQLRYQIIISCLQRDSHVPESLVECSRVAMFLRPQTQAYGDRLIKIVIRISNLRADIKLKILTDNSEILPLAYAIEADLVAWLACLPPIFHYDLLDTTLLDSWSQCRGIHPYGNQYHSYRDFRVSNVWNQYRCARILNCEIILNCLGKLSSKSATGWSTELKSHMSSLRVTARQMAIDICATIPFHFGAGAPNDSEESFVPDNESYIGGLVIQWPLFIAAASEAKNHPLRKWVIGCLKAIGHTMGINQAFAVVDIVRTAKGFFDKTDQEDSLFIEDVLRSDELTEILGQQTSPLDF
ncbi:hypothetical protein ASPWEDRAFT_51110 [Aspergillus wentii DTO 134E9]|uniref:Zn(2)-C6 fungal-type domain-containing protein n=1 Tax=Aspergillus wentii DTO 134E9 TaxID=1073089 RepID=A0A1L9RJ27_ASPWE|nr:uncharacterized protein ASPWEDRAFT_51110 [Aspergillus wentii DTO 134E9]OJJ34858.1 hypothetical protein ASPWEDRAFT_51110 [Aspergillus wentii DTO 134E9]